MSRYRRLILASASGSRRALVERLGLPFEAIPAGVDESARPGEAHPALAERLALAKAEAVVALHPEALVIGSDQVGVCRDLRLSKPGSIERAVEQLSMIHGDTAYFYTGVALIDGATGQRWSAVERCEVRLRPLRREEILRYVALEQPVESAGAFLAESLGPCLFEWVRADDPTTLLGLPLIRLCAFLRAAGVDPLAR
jgi:MAF protein